MFMRSLYIVISRPCGPKSFMGISRPRSRNCYPMYVERGGIIGEMLPNFSGLKIWRFGIIMYCRTNLVYKKLGPSQLVSERGLGKVSLDRCSMRD